MALMVFSFSNSLFACLYTQIDSGQSFITLSTLKVM